MVTIGRAPIVVAACSRSRHSTPDQTDEPVPKRQQNGEGLKRVVDRCAGGWPRGRVPVADTHTMMAAIKLNNVANVLIKRQKGPTGRTPVRWR